MPWRWWLPKKEVLSRGALSESPAVWSLCCGASLVVTCVSSGPGLLVSMCDDLLCAMVATRRVFGLCRVGVVIIGEYCQL